MTLTPNWRITDLTRDLSDGYVSKVNYVVEITYEQDGISHVHTNSYVINLEKPETLIPYADLTNDTVAGWIKDLLGAESVTSIEEFLISTVTEILTPTTGNGLPW